MKIFEGSKHSSLKKSILGAHPIIQYYLEKLRVGKIFRSYVKSGKHLAIPIEDYVCLKRIKDYVNLPDGGKSTGG